MYELPQKAKQYDPLETAQELGQRFPDLTAQDIIDHVEDVCEMNVPRNHVMYYAIIACYEGQEIKKVRERWLT